MTSARQSVQIENNLGKSPRKQITTARLSPNSGKIVTSKVDSGLTARMSPNSGKLVSSKVTSGLTGITSRLSPPRTSGMIGKSEYPRNTSNSKLEQLKVKYSGRRSPTNLNQTTNVTGRTDVLNVTQKIPSEYNRLTTHTTEYMRSEPAESEYNTGT